jgi:AcrR family transcriptional regulator
VTRERTTTQARAGRGVVLRSAVECFRAVGYHGTTIRGIADGAGITAASIYHHFASKQEILQEIMVGALRDVIGETRDAVLAAGGEPADQLAALVRAWVLFHATRQAEALIGASEIRSLDPAGHHLVVMLRDEQEQFFRSVIARGVDAGRFRTRVPPVAAARALIAMGTAVSSWYRAGDTTPEQLAEQYVELALGAVLADL